ncbi:U-box domain-containing protein 43-like [Humulus lupulus]|uniref:U-box domain-containing protein 43-like n=1 Tax=Humulus lupulus TaxID=3486 RepID=UPI002B410FAF|nr:U-box domain-containing protein 43-like [Humulus lupulus]
MAKDVIISVSVIPASELLTHIVLDLFETAQSAKKVLFQKDNFITFSTHLEKTAAILKELSKQNLDHSESLKSALTILNRELKAAKQLIEDCSKRNKLYLFFNCRKIVKQLDSSTKEISQALSLIPLASLDVSLSINDKLSELCKSMLEAEYQAAVVEEEILAKIELGIQERNGNHSYANNLLFQIAEALGLSTEKSALKKEYEEFIREIEDANVRKEQEESLQMDQIIALLENADAATSSEEKEKKYLERRNSLGNQHLLPLKGFYCSITHEVMVDPVETSSRQTFERSAIERWLAEGNNLCPLTNAPLDAAALRPNKTLRQSIEEWRDRNTIITIVNIKPQLQSDQEEEVLQALSLLHKLCIDKELHREWATLEDCISVLVGLLGRNNRDLRKEVLVILSILAKDSEDKMEKITRVDGALESIVRSLARQYEESKAALHLLLELSRSNVALDLIGNAQGCILLLLTMLSSEDNQVATEALQLLEILSLQKNNVKQMAKANYFKPLLQLLSSGPEDVRMCMAETLAEIELTNHSKLAIVKDGGLRPLIEMLAQGDLEAKKAAIKSLLQLSNLPQNGLQMIKEGAVRPLFEVLYCHSLQSPALREQVAATIMYLSISTANQESDGEQVSLLESEEDIFKLFSLISLTGPEIKQSILKTFHSLCQSPSGLDIRMKLRQLSAVQVLVPLCEVHQHSVRANAVKLFFCLTENAGDDSTFLEHVNQRCIETLLKIIRISNDVEEIASALGIIAYLPKNPEMNQWLLEAEALQIIYNCLNDGNRDVSYKSQVVGNAVGAICRFTVSTNQEWQHRVAEAGLIQVLVRLLASGTSFTKQNAAIALKQLSESSKNLSKPIKKRGPFLCCFSSPETGCPAHMGSCGVESSFCILEANAMDPLVRMLGEPDLQTTEAALDALLTLIDSQKPLDGIKVLDNANAIAAIIKLLSYDSAKLQWKCLKGLEMIFQLDELKRKYGGLVQMPLVDIAQKKASDMREIKSLAAKLLAQLGVLGAQSSFF